MTKLIHDPDLLDRLETDLINKAVAAFNEYNVMGAVFGVFDVDELEQKSERDLQGRIGVGVGYVGCEPIGTSRSTGQNNVSSVTAHNFTIFFAAPISPTVNQRKLATRMLTVLRRAILGSAVASVEGVRETQRRWELVRERPEITASTETMLYYTQVWRVDLPTNSA